MTAAERTYLRREVSRRRVEQARAQHIRANRRGWASRPTTPRRPDDYDAVYAQTYGTVDQLLQEVYA